MLKNCIQRCLISQEIKRLHIKTAVRNHFTLVRWQSLARKYEKPKFSGMAAYSERGYAQNEAGYYEDHVEQKFSSL